MYIDLESGATANVSTIRRGHPNVSLPNNPGDDTLAALGYARVYPTPRPSGDVVTEGHPEQGEDGLWYQTWEVREYTAEELAERLEQAKVRKQREINAAYQAELDAILADYPRAETLTWDKQEREARAWWAWHDPDGNNRAGAEPATPYLDALAASRGITLLDLVQRVIAKADAWISASGSATGKRQALEDQVLAVTLADYATTAEAIAAVEAVVW